MSDQWKHTRRWRSERVGTQHPSGYPCVQLSGDGKNTALSVLERPGVGGTAFIPRKAAVAFLRDALRLLEGNAHAS